MKLNTDRIISLCAMAIGLGSLFIVVYQTALTREAGRASVLPYLTIELNSGPEGTFLVASNRGVGPARIDDIRILRGAAQIESDPYAFYSRERLEDADDTGIYFDRVLPGMLIPAGSDVRMIGALGARRGSMLGDLLSLFNVQGVPQSWLERSGARADGGDRAVVEITYASVYGDRWRVRSDTAVPEVL